MKAINDLKAGAVGHNSICGMILAMLLVGCAPQHEPSKQVRAPDSMAILLAPHIGEGKLDSEIRRLQDEVRAGRSPDVSLERLGWAFVSKARETFDSGYYKLAEQCALALDRRQPRCPEALLLRGHVLHNLHKFKEAEGVARELLSKRDLPFDFGLLSDVLMEQGKLEEAFDACQKMIDLRPDLHSYARGAHLRWLRGDLSGAEKLMRRAADAASPRDAESAAWVYTRLAGYQFQAGGRAAEESCAAALELRPNYAPALLLRGRLLLAAGRYEQACECLLRAAELNPLPEYQWALAEAFRAANRVDEAGKVESDLSTRGASADPRTFALYLATHGQSIELAVRLAREELDLRKDIFTHDALAWALVSARRLDEAQSEMDLALAQGTQDARLFLHAATLAHKTGRMEEAQRFTARAEHFKHTLLPSERAHLEALRSEFAILVPRRDSLQ
jgi:tetratricopeptide (TPR) repeat protein